MDNSKFKAFLKARVEHCLEGMGEAGDIALDLGMKEETKELDEACKLMISWLAKQEEDIANAA